MTRPQVERAMTREEPRIVRWSCILSGLAWMGVAGLCSRFISPHFALLWVAFGVGYITDREAQRHGK